MELSHDGAWDLDDKFEKTYNKQLSSLKDLVVGRLPKSNIPESAIKQLHANISQVVSVKDLVDIICGYVVVQMTPDHIKFEDFISRYAAEVCIRFYFQRPVPKFPEFGFPPPQGLNINMMPFLPNQKESLPPEFHGYWPLIQHCVAVSHNLEPVWYLTIHEGVVQPGYTQRRAGLHTELPGEYQQDSKMTLERRDGWGCGVLVRPSFKGKIAEGSGLPEGPIHRGIFMASTLNASCAVYPVSLDPSVIDSGGSVLIIISLHIAYFLLDCTLPT